MRNFRKSNIVASIGELLARVSILKIFAAHIKGD
jgi:hypothetical protein